MNCIRCDKLAGFNRIAVNLLSGTEVGGFCRNCEFDEFGHSLDRFAQSGPKCAVCNRDGTYALAVWQPSLETDGRALISRVDYAVTERTALLCDEHFHEVVEDRRAQSGSPSWW